MGVASGVLSGAADCGLAVLSSARALGLDFIPVARERYDLAIVKEYYDAPIVGKLMTILRTDDSFRRGVLDLGGYDVSTMGEVVWQSS
jgi:putative molybdopterin biosynthesis protein